MKKISFIAVFFFCLTGCIDVALNTAHQRTYMPELVNTTGGKLDVILVFKHERDGGKGLYHVRLPVGASLPVWLDNYEGVGYLLGSYHNVVEEVLILEPGTCTELLARHRREGSSNYGTLMSEAQLSDFLASCRALARISGTELEQIRKASAFYPNDATCLMVKDDGTFTLVQESELPWYRLPSKGVTAYGMLSICADPQAIEKEPLF